MPRERERGGGSGEREREREREREVVKRPGEGGWGDRKRARGERVVEEEAVELKRQREGGWTRWGWGVALFVTFPCLAMPRCTPTSAVSNDAREPDDDHLNTCYS